MQYKIEGGCLAAYGGTLMKFFRFFVMLIAWCCLIYVVNPNTAYAGEWINREGNLNVEMIQNYLYQTQPESFDGYFAYYPLNDELYLEVSIFGDATVKSYKLQGLQLEYGNIHVPVGREEDAFVYSTEGAITVEGDQLVKYWYGQPISYQKLSKEVSKPKDIIKYKDEFLLVLSSEGDVYTIDSDGKVYTLRDKGDVRVIALTNYLDILDIQISIITNEDEWYYTTETHFGNWYFVQNNTITFTCDGIIVTYK